MVGKCLFLLTKPKACSTFKCSGFKFNTNIKSQWSRLHRFTSWPRVSAEMAPTTPVGRQLAPPAPMLPWRGWFGSARSSPRINVLLCHHRGYDLCNAAERVRLVKHYTRSISGRNVLAAARRLDTQETKIKKKDWSGFVTGLTPDSAL